MVSVSGSYLVVEHLAVDVIDPYRRKDCLQDDGTPVRFGWYVGFSVGGQNDTVRYSEMSDNLSVGVFLAQGASHDRVLHNSIHDLGTLWKISEQPYLAQGVTGILIHGDDHEVAYNESDRNVAHCTLTWTDSTGAAQTTDEYYSAGFELYNSNRVAFHHNVSFGNQKYYEMGKDSAHTADDNLVIYNLFVSDVATAQGPNIHGNDQFGPVRRTIVEHNTIVFSGANSDALVVGGNATIARNNILIAGNKAAFFGGTFTEDHNLYWRFGGSPFVQFASGAISPTSKKLDPMFVNMTATSSGDFRLRSGSPAIDAGAAPANATAAAVEELDLDGKAVPRGSAPDIGGYEY